MAGRIARRVAVSIARRILGLLEIHHESVFRAHVAEGHVLVGLHTYGTPNVQFDRHAGTRVFIGKYCSIASGVVIFNGSNHNPQWVSTYPFRIKMGLPGAFRDGHPASKGDVRIGNDVWIGAGAIVLSGVSIGDGAVIGAGAVVSRDVEPYVVAAGNPAVPVRTRFPSEVVDQLLKIRWWDWPADQVQEAVPLLCSDRIEEFIARHAAKA